MKRKLLIKLLSAMTTLTVMSWPAWGACAPDVQVTREECSYYDDGIKKSTRTKVVARNNCNCPVNVTAWDAGTKNSGGMVTVGIGESLEIHSGAFLCRARPTVKYSYEFNCQTGDYEKWQERTESRTRNESVPCEQLSMQEKLRRMSAGEQLCDDEAEKRLREEARIRDCKAGIIEPSFCKGIAVESPSPRRSGVNENALGEAERGDVAGRDSRTERLTSFCRGNLECVKCLSGWRDSQGRYCPGYLKDTVESLCDSMRAVVASGRSNGEAVSRLANCNAHNF